MVDLDNTGSKYLTIFQSSITALDINDEVAIYDAQGILKEDCAGQQTGELLVARGYAWFKWDGLKVIEAYNAFDPTEYNKVFSE